MCVGGGGMPGGHKVFDFFDFLTNTSLEIACVTHWFFTIGIILYEFS